MKAAGLVLIATLAALPAAQWANAATTETVLTTERIDAEETSFGDLTTDALCAAATTNIALAPAEMFREGEIRPGPVSAEAVQALLHDPSEGWAVLELTGAQLREAIERSVSFAPTPRAFFLQISGLRVVYDPDAPRGRKVRSLSVGSEPLSEAAKYEVAMPETLSAGGSGYFTIFGDAPKVRSGLQGIADLIMAYANSKGTLSYTGQGRIVVGG